MASPGPPTGTSGLFETLRADFRKTIGDARRTGYGRTVSQTLDDLESYYLTDPSRRALAEMNAFKRFFVRTWWLFKALVFKLAPGRRVLLACGVIAVVLSIVQVRGLAQGHSHWTFIGLACILLVLMLELREKLVAHDELAEGRAIQKALLPKAAPSIAGFDIWLDTTPANDVGGDIVDVLQANDDRFFLLLGDVAGKGLGAALLAARLQATFRALAPDSSTLSDVGARLNRIFCRDGPSNRFATIVALAGRPDYPTLRVMNAGHPAALLSRAGEVSLLPPGGPALGIVAGAGYFEHEVTLAPGDTLVVYSDGATEAMNAEGQLFGEERLVSALQAHGHAPVAELGARLKSIVRDFEGAARPHDDLSLIIVRKGDGSHS